MQNKTRHIIPILLLLLLMTSCVSRKDYAYLNDAPRDVAMPIENSHTSTIQPGDELYIYVYSENSEAVKPFNQETNTVARHAKARGYIVSQNNDIIFPSLGRINVAGKTNDQLAREIEGRLIQKGLVRDPIVTVSLLNFRVTVIGEVAKPQQLAADGNRLTIFEAIARCGDVTMDGVRSCVTVLRQTADTYIVDTVDLTSKTILNSPYYYLQQNDIVYVEPTPRKKRIAYRNEDWPHYLTTGVAAVRIAYTLVYRYAISPTFRNRLRSTNNN